MGMIRAEYIHHTFEGAVRNLDGSYSCPNTLQTGCYGITGEEVLDSLSNIVYNISSTNTFWEDLALLLGIAACFKLLFVAVSYSKCFRVKTIGAPSGAPKFRVEKPTATPGAEGSEASISPGADAGNLPVE